MLNKAYLSLRKELTRIGKELMVNQWTDWYECTSQTLVAKGGKEIFRKYNLSLPQMLEYAYPEYPWHGWRFAHVPHEFWDNFENQEDYFMWLSTQLGIKSPDHWYQVTRNQVNQHYGRALLLKYGDTLITPLKLAFPEYSWHPWRFARVPAGYWEDLNNQIEYIEWLKDHLSLGSMDDWYGVNIAEFRKHGGRSLALKYSDSLYRILCHIYPFHRWQSWRFAYGTRYSFDDYETRHEFMCWCAAQLSFTCPEDWYGATTEDLVGNGGGALLSKYNNSVSTTLSSLYPDYPWQLWQFHAVPRGYWDDVWETEKFVEYLAAQFKIETPEQWHNVKTWQIYEEGGMTLLGKYGRRLFSMLKSLYPDYQWLPWKFEKSPRRLLDDDESRRNYFDWLTQKLCIRTLDNWYDVSLEHLGKFKCTEISDGYHSFVQLLQRQYPKFPWKLSNFEYTVEKSQRFLKRVVQTLLPPDTSVEINAMLPYLQFPSKSPVSLDVYIPSLALGLEYHGGQHYFSTRLHGLHTLQQARDESNREMCAAAGVTLIEVPYWWEFDSKSVRATIQKYRPDVVLEG